MSVRPLRFAPYIYFPSKLSSIPISFPVIPIDDGFIVCELISAHITCNSEFDVSPGNGGTPYVTLTTTFNGNSGETSGVCLFVQPVAFKTEVNNGASKNFLSPLGTVRIDYTDGRGNGILIPVEKLWLSAPANRAAFTAPATVVLNILYRQKFISAIEFEAVKSTFG